MRPQRHTFRTEMFISRKINDDVFIVRMGAPDSVLVASQLTIFGEAHYLGLSIKSWRIRK